MRMSVQVAHLSTFLLMTVFPQMPLVVFLAYFQALRYPIDSILGSFLFIFLVCVSLLNTERLQLFLLLFLLLERFSNSALVGC